ncbi:hypothetical protein H8356DRAFT_258768 [Neocallimastix lanati (nom. inval.)]|jgi:hypothetical protein|uniref:Uncharacterized protein n=1 Tax=Neocallimastix californiae TaxID=1754190 RepID=A0A1Y2F4U8_9FUNG|nr:hypothetical protein H8356DRAFT_258768 [Neocallimastix sp. JGI-2020a]ORY77955.1 hypothetical protein LY90DRAFT_665200 [Neocallimastix californiae]|eukprot:ORY77955.1 hypothetical protein LY90DRAFT_665200 [Neocallimastix californiae]
MQDLIYFSEQVYINGTVIYEIDTSDNDITNYQFKKIDSYQNIFNVYLKSSFFPWVCLILILNEGSWHKPINLLLIVHWILRATGDLFRNLMQLNPIDFGCYWPYSSKNWLISNGIAHIFWLSGEMVGDWYLFLRSKAIIQNKTRLKMIFCTCILFNLTKVFGMYCYFIHTPMNLRIRDDEDKLIPDLNTYNIAWWSTVFFIEITCCLYELTVIYALKKEVLNRIEKTMNYKYNPFIEKFRQISEFRILTSVIISIIFLPFVAFFIGILIKEYLSDLKEIDYVLQDGPVEQLRQVVLSFNYSFIYIDQVLLRRLIRRKSRINSYNLSHPTLVIHDKSYTKIDTDTDMSEHENTYTNHNLTVTIPESLASSYYNIDTVDAMDTLDNLDILDIFNNNYKNSYSPYLPKKSYNSLSQTNSPRGSFSNSKITKGPRGSLSNTKNPKSPRGSFSSLKSPKSLRGSFSSLKSPKSPRGSLTNTKSSRGSYALFKNPKSPKGSIILSKSPQRTLSNSKKSSKGHQRSLSNRSNHNSIFNSSYKSPTLISTTLVSSSVMDSSSYSSDDKRPINESKNKKRSTISNIRPFNYDLTTDYNFGSPKNSQIYINSLSSVDHFLI